MNPESNPRDPAYEPRDVQPSGTLMGIAVFFAGIAVCLLVSAQVYRMWEKRLEEGRDGRPVRPFTVMEPRAEPGRAGRPSLPHEGEAPDSSFRSGPWVETDIERDWRVQTAAVQDHLENYAWVDRPGGWVRIPIERAMELSVSESAQHPSPK
jgi:hypothetical protein